MWTWVLRRRRIRGLGARTGVAAGRGSCRRRAAAFRWRLPARRGKARCSPPDKRCAMTAWSLCSPSCCLQRVLTTREGQILDHFPASCSFLGLITKRMRNPEHDRCYRSLLKLSKFDTTRHETHYSTSSRNFLLTQPRFPRVSVISYQTKLSSMHPWTRSRAT